jgi:hypothetical protein
MISGWSYFLFQKHMILESNSLATVDWNEADAGARRLLFRLLLPLAFAASLVLQFVWGFPATFVLFALVGLTLVFMVSLLVSPLGLNLVDSVILPGTIITCHIALSRYWQRSDPMWGWGGWICPLCEEPGLGVV